MSTIRIQKTKNYSVISNHHLRNKTLSLKAMGLLTLLLSLPDDWSANVKHLATICKDGKKAIYSAIKELRAEGYIDHVAIRDDKARVIKWEYIVYENPLEKPVNSGSDLLSQKVEIGKVKIEKGDGIRKTEILLRNTEKNERRPASPSEHPKPIPANETPSSSFSFDLKGLASLLEAVPEERQSKPVEARLRKALKAGITLAVLLDCIAYTTDHAPKDYAAYLGNCIDKGWASEGYHAEKAAEEARRKELAEETRRKKQADQKREQAEEARRKEEADRINGQLDEVSAAGRLDALDEFISGQPLNAVEKSLFKKGQRSMLRRRFVADFLITGVSAIGINS